MKRTEWAALILSFAVTGPVSAQMPPQGLATAVAPGSTYAQQSELRQRLQGIETEIASRTSALSQLAVSGDKDTERLKRLQHDRDELTAYRAVLQRQIEDLQRLECPVLIVSSDEDKLRSVEESEEMARQIPQSRLEIIGDCGHMTPMEKPQELFRIISDWIVQSGL